MCQNSWGKHWGNNGKFILPYATKFCEARGIVDYEIGDTIIKRSHTGTWWNIFYKCINTIVNMIQKLIDKK